LVVTLFIPAIADFRAITLFTYLTDLNEEFRVSGI